MYSPLELDEIRLERATDREGILAGKIDKMKVPLGNMTAYFDAFLAMQIYIYYFNIWCVHV